ncbi:MAG: glycosyltransferase family 1 protein [Roseivirga sp.]|nr:glycosyltransferase family 1 protein [Roseivirga sp.]
MKIVISAFGTRGDVQPMIGIAVEAIRRGHQVLVVVSKGMQPLLNQYQIPYALYQGLSAQEQFGKLGGGHAASTQILKRIKEHMISQVNELPGLCGGADILIGNNLDAAAASVAEYCGIPYVRIGLTPVFAGDGRPTTIALQSLSKRMNKWTWKLGLVSWELLLKPQLNKARKILGLAHVPDYYHHSVANPSILCLDKRLAPPSSDWPVNVSYSGYPFLPTQDELPEELLDFVEAGEPPVYFGFGSMGSSDPKKTTATILSAIKSSGLRAIIHKGWAGLGGEVLPDHVMEIADTCHLLLFPYLSGIVHHGGAGTTHTAAVAGIPQLVIPHITDQFYYGQSVFENELGPKPVPFKRLNGKNLAAALTELRQPQYKKKAQEFGGSMELDGTDKTLDLIEQYGSGTNTGKLKTQGAFWTVSVKNTQL